MSLPASISFASLLQYVPKKYVPFSESAISVKSQKMTGGIKQDAFISEWGVYAINYAAKKAAEIASENLGIGRFIGPDAILIPVPRRAPLVKMGLWPALRICEELKSVGMAKEILPILERVTAVQKSATAEPDARPWPLVHYESLAAKNSIDFSEGSVVTLVDDVVTRGATFLGAYARLKEFFPKREIRCFALVRTKDTPINDVLDPVVGTITYRPPTGTQKMYLHRDP